MGLGSYNLTAPRVRGGGLGAYTQWPMSYNQFITDIVRVSEGGTTLPQIKAYMLKQIDDGLAKLSKYSYQITSVVSDKSVQAALKIEYDAANDMTSVFQNIKNTKGSTIDASNIQGIWREMNEWRGGITHVAQVIDAVPGAVGIGVRASKLAEQAKTQMLQDPAYREAANKEGFASDQYFVLLGQQLYAKAMAAELSKVVGATAMGPINAQIAANAKALAEYKANSFIETLSDKNPDFERLLDEGWWEMIKRFLDKYKWWILGIGGGVGGFYLAGKYMGNSGVTATVALNPRRKFKLQPRGRRIARRRR